MQTVQIISTISGTTEKSACSLHCPGNLSRLPKLLILGAYVLALLQPVYSYAQEVAVNKSKIETEKIIDTQISASTDEPGFYPILLDQANEKQSQQIFLKSVTKHIISYRGIQDFYLIHR